MRNKRSLILGICLLFLSLVSTGSVEAETRNVCSSSCTYSTIQSAINASNNGDTVLVSDGTYTENIDFSGKAITVTSVNGASSTTIDGNQNGSVVTFDSGEGSGSVLDGFKLTNGSGTNNYYGGGIYCSSTSPSITNCTITDNTVTNQGAGIYCSGSSPEITNCKINSNINKNAGGGAGIYGANASVITLTNSEVKNNDGTDGSWGGGLYIDHASATITNCSINNNTTMYYGAGIGLNEYTSSSYPTSVTIINSTINDNTSTQTGAGGAGVYAAYYCSISASNSQINNNWAKRGQGGGIVAEGYGSFLTLTGCTISGNSIEDGNGGGIATWNDVNTIADCTISNNSASDWAGGISAYGEVTITNSLIVENSAITTSPYHNYGGGGVYLYEASPAYITNCTISSNYTSYHGGGVVVEASSATITNSILWNNSAALSDDEIYTTGGGSVTVTYSDVENSWIGSGNINSDPLFLDATNGDYHLTSDSPCIDTGINSAPNIPSYDFEGDPRIFDADDDGTAVVDMGADEFPVIAAEVESKDDPIDVTDSGSYVDIYVELPAGNVEDIDINTVLLTTPEGSVYASGSGSVDDRDSDGIDDIKYKFNASSVYAILTQNGSTRLTITGELTDDTPFQGSVIVTVTGN